MNIFENDFITIGKNEILKDKFNKIKNSILKPYNGLWASMYNEDYISEWHIYTQQEGFRVSSDGVIFKLNKNSNIFIIDNYFDYIKLIDLAGVIPIDDIINMIDYENLSTILDGVYFTSNSMKDLEIHNFYFNNNYTRYYKGVDMCLYAYDCDTLILFNIDCIIDSEHIKIKQGDVN